MTPTPDPATARIAEQCATRRRGAGLSQSALAGLLRGLGNLDWTRTVVCKIEMSGRMSVTVQEALDLAAVFGVPLTELLDAPARPESITAALAAEVRAARARLVLEQQDVADRMMALGHRWSRPTVSQVEREHRQVSAAELVGLARVFGISVDQLLRR